MILRDPRLTPWAGKCCVVWGSGHWCDELPGHTGLHVCECGITHEGPSSQRSNDGPPQEVEPSTAGATGSRDHGQSIRRFRVYRPHPPEEYYAQGAANQPEEVQFEGVVFSDGTVCVRWLTEYRSHSIWACWEDLERIHGHPEYGTKVVWIDDLEG